MLSLYFDKDIVEKAFHSLKGITQVRPIRHWLAEHVRAHVFLCYLAWISTGNNSPNAGSGTGRSVIWLDRLRRPRLPL